MNERSFIFDGGEVMADDSGRDKGWLIRQAATKVFSKKGYFQTSAHEIAEEAGVSVGTIYNYFGSKQDILLDIYAEEFEDRQDFYEELSTSDLPLVEQIKRILDRHFSQLTSHKELMQVIIQERFKPGSSLGQKLNQRYEEVVHYIEMLVSQALKQGQIRQCNPRVIASALFGAVESVVAYGMLKDEKEQKALFRRAPEELAEFFWKGIKKDNQ